ncbi:hypothetical protein DQ384_31645 [Sphaerisporangium album]|uniref:Uncharacterized protein n=1 Tax=Sphaerisporangium album TaxID=509200 RepID=A0A367F4X1_9ACTN|nr:DUF6069 family protein [Sphaerisporangium album]RCG25418.1 hypothetical protein DQ384_31645 [Sphaerisporangium album]
MTARTPATDLSGDAPADIAVRVPFRALLRTNLVATVLAAAATETFAALVRASGVPLAVGNPGGSASDVVPVTLGACAIALAMVMVVGIGIAALINRRASRPARTYRIVTSVLVLLSLVPPLTAAETSTGTKVTLVAAHLIAAAIIVPLVSRRLSPTR